MKKQFVNSAKNNQKPVILPNFQQLKSAVIEFASNKEDKAGLITTNLSVKEEGWIKGSLMSPFNNYENEVIEDFAADIFYNLAKGHNLINGNKRWGLMALLHFLSRNNFELNASNKEVLKLARQVVKSDRREIQKVKKKIKKFLKNKMVSIQIEKGAATHTID